MLCAEHAARIRDHGGEPGLRAVNSLPTVANGRLPQGTVGSCLTLPEGAIEHDSGRASSLGSLCDSVG